MPCLWFADFAEYLAIEISRLLDKNSNFYTTVEEVRQQGENKSWVFSNPITNSARCINRFVWIFMRYSLYL